MRLVSMIVVATAAMTGSAFATDAFIGQVGDGNEGFNVQLGQVSGLPSTAVIYQENDATTTNGHNALQVQIGPDNYAYTYQASDYYDHTAASWQDGTGNDSINVQLSSGDSGADTDFQAVTIQLGDNNTAVNWQDTADYGYSFNLTASAPSLEPTLGGAGAGQFLSVGLPSGFTFD
ncbi:hypothetical protein [Devosia sp.]|uniref:hypothetical protein n=1 Tax=Devosia sp. TaxID=1871048 RepID=UPI003A8D3A85